MTHAFNLPTFTRDVVMREVDGRNVAWVDQPNARAAMWSGFIYWLFGIPWTVFSLFWMVGASGYAFTGTTNAGQLLFASFGIPFVLIGFGMLSTPFYASWAARRTAYVIADDCLIVVKPKWRNEVEVKTLRLADALEITRSERIDGSGTLAVLVSWDKDSDGDRIKREIKLESIQEVRNVEQLVLGIRADMPRQRT
jgi:hypothetical protein